MAKGAQHHQPVSPFGMPAHGGPIATQPGERQAVPVESLYRVRLSLAEPLPALREMRGSVSIQAQRQSPAAQFLKATAAVLVRESGF